MATTSVICLAILALVRIVATLSISVSSAGGNATSNYQYGIMFEDISHSGDGGTYAELIQNRAFQGSAVFPATITPWRGTGGATILLDTDTPLSDALPNSLRIRAGSSARMVGVSNPGWWGMDIKASKLYNGSFYAHGPYSGQFVVQIVSDITKEVLASVNVTSKSTADKWTQHTYDFVPLKDAQNSNNSFTLQWFAQPQEELKLNLISLFPPTYNNRPNGNRQDLMENLKGLNPTFFRVPGGNNLEGQLPPYLWNFTETIGPLAERPGRPGTWSYENTDGHGIIEYFNWCADLDVDAVWALWGGLYLDGTVIAKDDLQPYIDFALDELEFIMGDKSTPWGSKRASLGYPDPFPLKYVEVGNEDNLSGGLTSYDSYRFPMFYDAISAKYPNLVIFSSTPEVIYKDSAQDYHQYTRPDQFVSQFSFFDNWKNKNTIMIGEYATVQNNSGKLEGANFSEPRNPWPYWVGAVGEAVFLLGAERNSPQVWGAAYAPTFQNLNSYEWAPDLIAFTADPAQTILSTSYHVIKLLANNLLTHTLPTKSDSGFNPAFWVAGKNEQDGTHLLKMAVYNSTADVPISVHFEGLASAATAQLTVLSAGDPYAHNEPKIAEVVHTVTSDLASSGNGSFSFTLPSLSVAVLVAKG